MAFFSLARLAGVFFLVGDGGMMERRQVRSGQGANIANVNFEGRYLRSLVRERPAAIQIVQLTMIVCGARCNAPLAHCRIRQLVDLMNYIRNQPIRLDDLGVESLRLTHQCMTPRMFRSPPPNLTNGRGAVSRMIGEELKGCVQNGLGEARLVQGLLNHQGGVLLWGVELELCSHVAVMSSYLRQCGAHMNDNALTGRSETLLRL